MVDYQQSAEKPQVWKATSQGDILIEWVTSLYLITTLMQPEGCGFQFEMSF